MDICCVMHGAHPDNGIRVRKDLRGGPTREDSFPRFSAGSCIGAPPAFRDVGEIRFIFEIDGMNDDEAAAINSEHADVAGRMRSVKERGHGLRYTGVRDENFFDDLMMVASDLPEIMGAALIELYANGVSGAEDIAHILTEKNPAGYDDPRARPFYPYRLGCFLYEMVVGVDTAGVFWVGVEDADGRHMMVKENGETIYYKVYTTNKFRQYLLKNARLVIPAASEHASIERTDDGRHTIDLSMQISFSPRKDGPSSTLR